MADESKKPTAAEIFLSADIETIQVWIAILEESAALSGEYTEGHARFIHACKLRIEELKHKDLFTQNVKIIR